ncbi:TonB-dependent receptor [Paraliomyxa miuraensis]|uniref:TonB-dependent receptor n=1 Tax=Paraliomyxa miuraensis TaxID=376150 RepID=UPI00224C90BC|nr:TonB-dependent receptor [Paraliomyxa miuraensis]MCX4241612.1 TonB-dependent receptor [Paraliomyxa miuraensis]
MRTKAWIWAIGALAAQAAVVRSAKADQGDAVIVGVVKDADTDDPIVEASVSVTGDNLIGEQAVVTDDSGIFRLPNLPPGEYTIEVARDGYELVSRTGVVLQANATVRIDTRLRRVDTETTRTLVVPAPTIDVGSAATGMNISSEFSKRVPVATPGAKGGATRSFEAVAEATPGARNDLYGTSIAGTTSPENNYVIDGISVNNPAYGINGSSLSVEFLQEVNVESGGYMPEFGRSTGGIVNAVTQSGGNELHGSVWGFYTPGRLEGQRKVVQREGSAIVGEPTLGWIGDAGFDIGGPIIEDRLWFYGGFQAARAVTNIDTSWHRLVVDPDTAEVEVDEATGYSVTERIPGTTLRRKAQATTFQVLGKLTFRANDNHTFDLLGIYSPVLAGGNGTYGVDARSGQPEVGNTPLGHYEALGNTYRDDSADVNFKWSATTDDKKWTFDTMIGWHHQISSQRAVDGSKVGDTTGLAAIPGVVYRRNDPGPHSILDFEDMPGGAPADACDPVEIPDTADPAATIRTETCPVQTYVINGPGFLFERQLERVQGRHMITRWAQGAGHHVIKGGVDIEYNQYQNLRGYSGGVLYRESPSGTTFSDYRMQGFLVGPDDAVVVNSLFWGTSSVTAGAFLQDSWNVMDKVTLNAGLRYDAQFLFAADKTLALALPNQISPRVGLIWDPTYEGKSKLFANYARFYQSVPLDIADRAASGDPGLASNHPADVCDPSDPVQATGICQTDEGRVPTGGRTDNDQVWSAIGAGRTPVDPDIKPQSSDELVFGGEYEIFANARLGVSYSRRWLNYVIEDMSRDEANTYFVGNPGYGIATDFPKAQRNYDAVIIYLHKRFADHWLMDASYTVSWLRGNIAGLFRPETGQLDPNINSDFDLISLLENRYGPLSGDHRHDIKLFGAGEIPLPGNNMVLAGGAIRARSGGPTNVMGSHYRYGLHESFILPRGSGERLPWTFSVDSNLGFRHEFSRDLALTVSMDVFNVLNLQQTVAVDQDYTFSDVNPIPGGTMDDLPGLTDINGAPVVENPNFGKPIAYQRPRTFRFGLRFEF